MFTVFFYFFTFAFVFALFLLVRITCSNVEFVTIRVRFNCDIFTPGVFSWGVRLGISMKDVNVNNAICYVY